MVKAAYETFKKLPRYLRTEDLPTHTFTPRTYQLDLLDAALAQNTIVCLNSASSKMFITVMLIKEVSKQVRRPWLVQEGKRIIYLASSAYYVEHHARVIAHHTDLTVGQYAEETTTAGWEEEAWVGELNNHQVLVMTAPILLKLLVFKYLHLSSMNLLIVDENHGVVKNPNHIEIMDYYKTCPDKDKPKIVVLTASLLTNKCKDPVELKNTISLLEHTFHCTAETSTLVFSERHGTSPKEIVYECESREDPTNLTPVIASVLENALLFVYECSLFVDEDEGEKDPRQIPKTALSECLNILYELGPWCANHVSEMLVKQIEKLEQHENIDLNKHFLRFTATQLRLVSKIFEQYFTPDYLVDELLHYVSPKVVKLVTVLRKYRPEVDFMIIREDDDDGDDMMGSSSDMSDESSDMSDSDQEDSSSSSKHHKPVHIAIKYPHCQEDSTSSELLAQEEEKRLCGLIFVERKYVAYALNKVIEEICAWDEELCFVKSYHITGQGYRGNSSKKESSISHRRHEEILRKFRMQDLNLLIATSSLEERIDIPKCNLVVRFDSPKDYRSYSHSKARARARNAEFVMLIDKPKADVFTAELKTYKGIEQVLLGRCKEEEEILLPEAYHVSSPSLVKADDSHQPITMFSAISVINRYCAKLPSDAFTHLTPKCTVEEVMKEKQCCYVARLKLPINSPKKEELKGQLMPTPKYAKMVVALEMCKLLQQQGELDNNFLPVGKEIFKYEDKDSELEEEEEAIGCPRPGTTKRKQYYFKKAADALLMSHPSKSKPCKLYNIRMTLTGPITEEQNTRGRKIYVPENTPQGFGILSSKFIPQYQQLYNRTAHQEGCPRAIQ